MLESVVIETAPSPDAAVIWLHGLGADGYDFVPIVRALRLPEDLRIRFIFPHAPVRPVTINGGMKMRAWYDIRTANLLEDVDREGIHKAQQLVAGLIDREIERGILPSRMLLMGFSQGGVLALECGLRYRPSINAIGMLSSYVALPEELPPARSDSPPILLLHGTQDTLVPLTLAEIGRKHLEELGYRVTWRYFVMGHEVRPEEVEYLRRWLLERLQGP